MALGEATKGWVDAGVGVGERDEAESSPCALFPGSMGVEVARMLALSRL